MVCGKWPLFGVWYIVTVHFPHTIHGKWLHSKKNWQICHSFNAKSLADHFSHTISQKVSTFQGMVCWKCSLSVFYGPEIEHFLGYGTRKVIAFRDRVCRKWFAIHFHLREIVAKIESISWVKTRAWGTSIHGKTRVLKSHAKAPYIRSSVLALYFLVLFCALCALYDLTLGISCLGLLFSLQSKSRQKANKQSRLRQSWY